MDSERKNKYIYKKNTGLLRYANNSNYKDDVMIRKEVYVGDAVLKELERIIHESEILEEDDHNWYACSL